MTETLTAPSRPRITWRQARVVEARPETPRARTLVLEVPGWPGHRAGQHVDVRLTAEDGYQTQRSYSIASPPEEARLSLTVERIEDGEVSPYLTDELRVGDLLELRGPVGGYFTWDAARDGGPLFLVAGGSGVAPLMSMLRHRAAARSRAPARLLYSARTVEDLFYREELQRLAAGDAGLEIIHTLTREQPAGWTGRTGRIDRDLLASVAWAPRERPLIYICGPTSLVEATASLLQAQGHAPERLKTERFGPTGN
ncbi:MAG TPA: ferredoxin reductase [Armatimonadota bacterium]|nr:ferredoxin reductase [Armatimonadota bacterium]